MLTNGTDAQIEMISVFINQIKDVLFIILVYQCMVFWILESDWSDGIKEFFCTSCSDNNSKSKVYITLLVLMLYHFYSTILCMDLC